MRNTLEFIAMPKDNNVIGTKWLFKNKINEQGEVVRNKERLLCKGYSHMTYWFWRFSRKV